MFHYLFNLNDILPFLFDIVTTLSVDELVTVKVVRSEGLLEY